jgi:DNA-directed RNA polymerase specialized sigma24 family protein
VTASAHSGHLGMDFDELRQPQTDLGDLIMIALLQEDGTQRQLLAEQPNIPSGVMQAVLMHALQLRRRCREVFLLCDIQQHSVAEAAAILGISRAAASRRLYRARRRMNDVIEYLCGTEPEQPKSKRTM